MGITFTPFALGCYGLLATRGLTHSEQCVIGKRQIYKCTCNRLDTAARASVGRRWVQWSIPNSSSGYIVYMPLPYFNIMYDVL